MTIAITDSALRRMGVRAAGYLSNTVTVRGGNAILVPDRGDTPQGVARTLTRLYGRPQTIDRGEIAYWVIGGKDVRTEG